MQRGADLDAVDPTAGQGNPHPFDGRRAILGMHDDLRKQRIVGTVGISDPAST